MESQPYRMLQTTPLVNKARKAYKDYDAAELKIARRLVQALRTTPPEVVVVADSSNFGFNTSGDTRAISTMVEESLGMPGAVFPIAGGGYHSGLWDAYFGLIEAAQVRPAVVMSLCSRTTCDPWQFHPVYHFTEQIEAIRKIDASTPLRAIRQRVTRHTKGEFRTFEFLPYKTIYGELRVGDYVNRIRGLPLDARERAEWIYAYHHGGDVRTGKTGLTHVEQFATTLARMGCKVVAYVDPVNVEYGTELHGAQFLELAEQNMAFITEHFTSILGDNVEVLPSATAFTSEEFVDPNDATEHLGPDGRLRLTAMIVDALAVKAPTIRKNALNLTR